MQSPGWQPTLCVAWCLIWLFANFKKKYGHTWHRMSLLRPDVIKQHKPLEAHWCVIVSLSTAPVMQPPDLTSDTPPGYRGGGNNNSGGGRGGNNSQHAQSVRLTGQIQPLTDEGNFDMSCKWKRLLLLRGRGGSVCFFSCLINDVAQAIQIFVWISCDLLWGLRNKKRLSMNIDKLPLDFFSVWAF